MSGDVHKLRRVRDSVPLRVWAVAMIGFWERAAFWGLTAPWQNYMEVEYTPQHDTNQTPGALGLGQVKATRIYCAFYIFYYVTPLIIAPIADCYLGQYTTLVTSVALYCLGCTVLTVSSLPSNLIKGWGLPGLIIAMVLIGLGGGGFKAIMPPFIADQYAETKPRLKTLKSGEKVVTDYQLTLQYIYNLSFWVGNIGSLSWFATVYIEKQYGFTGAYGLTLGLIVVALLMLLLGKKWYIRISHEDNVLPQAARIIMCAVRNGFNMKHAEPEYQLTHRRNTVPWSSHLVVELARGLKACRVLLAFIIFAICFDQMQNNLISQAGQMKTDKTPNDMLPAMNQVGCIIFGPLIQNGLYPMLHKQRVYIKPITRIAIGFTFITLSMLYATIVQQAIYSSPPCYNHPSHCGHGQWTSKWGLKSSRPNVWVQAPLYFLIAIGEIFSVVTGLEYAYEHSPKDMKVFVQAINLLLGGVGSACALAIAEVAHDPNLVWLYTSLTSGMAVTTLIFWLVFRHYDKTHASDAVVRTPSVETGDPEKEKTKTKSDGPKPSALLSTATFVVPALSESATLEQIHTETSRLESAQLETAHSELARPESAHSVATPPKLAVPNQVPEPRPLPVSRGSSTSQSLREGLKSQDTRSESLDDPTMELATVSSTKDSALSTEESEVRDKVIAKNPTPPSPQSEEPQPTVAKPLPAIPSSLEHSAMQRRKGEGGGEVTTEEPTQQPIGIEEIEERGEATTKSATPTSPTSRTTPPTTTKPLPRIPPFVEHPAPQRQESEDGDEGTTETPAQPPLRTTASEEKNEAPTKTPPQKPIRTEEDKDRSEIFTD